MGRGGTNQSGSPEDFVTAVGFGLGDTQIGPGWDSPGLQAGPFFVTDVQPGLGSGILQFSFWGGRTSVARTTRAAVIMDLDMFLLTPALVRVTRYAYGP